MKIFTLLLLFSTSIFAQDALTNKDIIEMTKTGLPPAVIISKIKTSKVNFQVEVVDLKSLTDEKVSDIVVASMVERQWEQNKPKEIEFTIDQAEFGTLSEIKNKFKVFLKVDDIQARSIIAEALLKNTQFSLVSTRAEADFAIGFGLQRVDKGSNVLLGSSHNIVVVGEMFVYTYLPVNEGDTKGRIRVLWQKRKQQDYSGGFTFDRHPAKQVIGEFVKDWKKIK